MKAFLSKLLNLHDDEIGLVVLLSSLLLASGVAGEISGIVAVSNFLETSGVNGMLIVWTLDMLLVLVMTGLQSLVIDRFDRLSILRWMTLSFVGAFVILRMMFVFKAPPALTYALLQILSTQQLIIFPLFFWILASDICDVAQSKRLFPVIAGLGFVGSLVGTVFAALQPGLFARADVPETEVLTFNVLIYLLVFVVLQTGFQAIKVRKTAQQTETVKETLMEGWEFVKEVPSFRFLMFALFALAICDVIVEFRFLEVSEAIFTDPGALQRFYGLYRLLYIVAGFAIQTFLTGRLIARLGLKNIFLLLPVLVLGGLGWLVGMPGIISALGAVLVEKLAMYAVDEPARKSFQALVPEERRGRVSIFMDSYLYAGGSIVGILFTLAVVLVASRTGFAQGFYVYLGLGVVAASLAIFSILKMRKVYDSSLFNWRLKRRQRRSNVLDKLDF